MANYRTLGTDFSEGLRAPHYTNGRLLTAEDLQQDQRTQLERLAQTGRAAGYGIVEGFQVTAVSNQTALRITAGLGLNRHGNVVHLAVKDVTLPVQPVADDDDPVRRSGRFEACVGGDGDQPATTADGAYLLVVAPLAQLEGSVPRKACDRTGTPTCANQWEVEGVEFKIIRLVSYKPPTGNRANRNRNLLAHWFYGSSKLTTLMRDPLQGDANYTGYSKIATEDFNDCDLPLTVFFWSNGKIVFVDPWAVRRRIVHPYPSATWTANISDRRVAEGEARFLQFQQHVNDLQTTFGTNTDTIRAVDRFAYLPPVGILPVNPFELILTDVFEASLTENQKASIEEKGLTVEQVLERVRDVVLDSLGSRSAFSLDRFFGELLPPEYKIVHEDLVHDRLHTSWVQPPIQLPPPSIRTGLFDLVLADGTLMAVDDNNFDSVLNNINKKFTGTVFTHAPKRATFGTASETVSTAAAIGDLATAPFSIVAATHAFRPPREVFNPPKGDDDEVEPLVDIIVVDELLDPYRDQLARDMVGRIDDAISALSSPGGIFVGNNRFKAVNNSIANAFILNNFMHQASHLGMVDISTLLGLIKKGSQPIFYVVFARRRPPVFRRPLRL